jgi:hypothetical protein
MSRRPRRFLAALVVPLVAVGVVAVPSAGAQAPACIGVEVTATVAASAIPSGSWTTEPTCVPPDAVYETEVLGYRLIGGMGVARYTDGHMGHVAFLSAKVESGRSLSLVGVEDATTGQVTWAYGDGTLAEQPGLRQMDGQGEAATIAAPDAPAGPAEPAQVQLSISGNGTDLATAQGVVPDQLRVMIDQAVAALTS